MVTCGFNSDREGRYVVRIVIDITSDLSLTVFAKVLTSLTFPACVGANVLLDSQQVADSSDRKRARRGYRHV